LSKECEWQKDKDSENKFVHQDEITMVKYDSPSFAYPGKSAKSPRIFPDNLIFAFLRFCGKGVSGYEFLKPLF